MNGAWGSVCDSGGVFTTDEAIVACRQLGLLQSEGQSMDWILHANTHTHTHTHSHTQIKYIYSSKMIHIAYCELFCSIE